MARIESGALEAAPDPTVRPHWQVHFSVSDIRSCARITEAYGGSVLRESTTEAVLRDPDGARFTVTSRDAPDPGRSRAGRDNSTRPRAATAISVPALCSVSSGAPCGSAVSIRVVQRSP